MKTIDFRKANAEDIDLYYQWSNDPLVRENSFQQDIIPYDEHKKWFNEKLESKFCNFYLFFDLTGIPVGQVRIDRSNNETVVGLSLDSFFRGRGFGVLMLNMACFDYLERHQDEVIIAYIKEENIPSYRLFEKAGFDNPTKVLINGNSTHRLTRGVQ